MTRRAVTMTKWGVTTMIWSEKWSSKVPGKDIFQLKYIICPVNEDNIHWTVAIIFMEEKESNGTIRWEEQTTQSYMDCCGTCRMCIKRSMVETWMFMSGDWCIAPVIHPGRWMVSSYFISTVATTIDESNSRNILIFFYYQSICKDLTVVYSHVCSVTLSPRTAPLFLPSSISTSVAKELAYPFWIPVPLFNCILM